MMHVEKLKVRRVGGLCFPVSLTGWVIDRRVKASEAVDRPSYVIRDLTKLRAGNMVGRVAVHCIPVFRLQLPARDGQCILDQVNKSFDALDSTSTTTPPPPISRLAMPRLVAL
jgi:hypothetical protein